MPDPQIRKPMDLVRARPTHKSWSGRTGQIRSSQLKGKGTHR